MGRVRSSFPRSRLPLHRRPFADPATFRRWLAVAVLAATTAMLVGHVVSSAEAARSRWGSTRPVLVADRSLQAGAPLAGAYTEARWPVALVPPGALLRVPAAGRADGPVATGTALTPSDVAEPPDEASTLRRMAVPVGATRIPLEVGDKVDVWATVDPSISGAELTTHRVATGATVTSAGSRSVVVAVAPAEVPAVAEAAALATVTLVATG